MKRALVIVSVATLLVIGVAVVGRALIVTQGIASWTPNGLPRHPQSVGHGRDRHGWHPVPRDSPLPGHGRSGSHCRGHAFRVRLARGGSSSRACWRWWVWSAWRGRLPSANSPIAFVTPLAVVPLVALFYAVSMART